jgi:hypothetical protein
MCSDHLTTGAAGLLRVAGLPVAALTDAGNPDLFDRLRCRTRSEAAYREFAAALAARLSRELIPHPSLSAQQRGTAVEVRRRLLRGALLDTAQTRALATAGETLGSKESLPSETEDLPSELDSTVGLSDELRRAADQSDELAAQNSDLDDAIRTEQARLAVLPWHVVTHCAAATRIVTETAPDLLGEIRDRLAAGEDWTGKRMRQRADYLLRLLARAAFKTTPRGWLGQVALIDTGANMNKDSNNNINNTGSRHRLLDDLRVGDYAVHRVANIHAERRALTAADELPDAWLSMTGLHWVRDDRLCCWTPDNDSPGTLRLIGIRHTQAVAAVRQVLGCGVVRTTDVVALLAPQADEHHRGVLRDFVRHLVRLGVVQVSARPAARLHEWSADPAAAPTRSGFVDVYRRGHGRVSGAALDRLGDQVAQVGRLAAVLRGDDVSEHPVLDLVDVDPRPVSEIVARFLDGREPQPLRRQEPAWPSPRPGTAYQRLRTWLDGHADDTEIDITADVLDRIGAPPAQPPSWPVDALVRPLRDGRQLAVLEALLPAGVVDARFSDALRRLHGRLPQVDAYRAFLDETAARCGVECVEVLVPPQGDRSANAVRRPHYTHTWTGDADLSTYLSDNALPGRYLPLDRVTLRRQDGRVVAEDPSGGVLWPVCHATRVPPAPWDLVLTLLTAASPIGRLAPQFSLGDHMTAFPGRERVGRLVVDGGLVLAGRSARLDRASLPRPGTPVESRVRELAELRTATGLPRWNFVRAAGTRRPRPVDLDSITALRTFDRLLADPAVSSLVVEEMLPDPDHLCVQDESGDGLAAQLLLRLPHRATPAQLADAVADACRAGRPRPADVVAVC